MQISRRRRLYFTDDPSYATCNILFHENFGTRSNFGLVISSPRRTYLNWEIPKIFEHSKVSEKKNCFFTERYASFSLTCWHFFFSITSLKNFDVKLISCGGVNYSLAATVFLSLKIVCILFSLRFLFYKQTR